MKVKLGPKYKGNGHVWETPSSSREGVMHYTMFLQGIDPICTCEGYQYNQKCRHIDDVMQREHEGS
jgi:hypothetical protein